MTILTVGNDQEFSTVTAAVAAASTGDTINVQAGTYTNDFPSQINGLTIEGVGGIAKFVATAQPGNGKAIFDVAGNTTLKNLDISGVTVPDANGAAIRYESGNLIVQNTLIHGNQNGILGAPDGNGSIAIDGSEIYGNGSGTGFTHNLYIGDIATFTLTNSYVHDANVGHEIKSRAATNIITNNRIEDGSSSASYQIDLPNGGNATISGNTIQKSANSGNRVTIAYGEEGNAHSGTSVSITDNVLVSDQSGANVIWDATNAAVSASGNSIYGYGQIDKSGNVSNGGFTTLGSRPTLDTSSHIDRSGGSNTPTPTPIPATDTTAPQLTVTESKSGITNGPTDTIGGTVTDSGSGVAKVEIYDTTGGRTVDLGTATLSNGAYAFSASSLANGTHAFTAIATDKAGNATRATAAGASLTVDTIAPTLTATQSISGTTTKTGNTLSGTVSDSGTGVAAVEIFLTSGNTTADLGSATLNGSTWSYDVGNLAPGTYSFAAAATDKAGNITARIGTGTSETVAAPAPTTQPPPPTATQPGLQSVSRDSGGLVFHGTAQPGSRIVLDDTADGQAKFVSAVIARSDGTWNATVGTIDTRTTNTLTTLFVDNNSLRPVGGAMILSSTASETLSGTAGQSDLFAFLPSFGKDIIRGFETTAKVGAAHDVIDLAGSNYQSFQQLRPQISGTNSAVIRVTGADTITLSGVSANSLQASDFRFS